jgi:hypothetical protein
MGRCGATVGAPSRMDLHRRGRLHPRLPGLPAARHRRGGRQVAGGPPPRPRAAVGRPGDDPVMTARHATPPPPRRVPPGRALALLQSPTIDVERVVVEGVGRPELRKGPGHTPSMVLPVQPGTFSVSGQRTTYGAPFSRLDELRNGDRILLRTRAGRTSPPRAAPRSCAPPTAGCWTTSQARREAEPHDHADHLPSPLLGPPAADRGGRRPHRQHPQARRSGHRGGPVSARSGADAANW